MQNSTDLEAAVLGAIFSQGPCTAYRVRERFRRSLSAHWNCSTGAIYPMFARLEQRNLIRPAKGSEESFGVKYEITPKGTQSVRDWLLKTPQDGAQLMNFDPLRARLSVMAALSVDERTKFIESTRMVLKDHLKLIRKDVRGKKTAESLFDYLVARGAYLSVRNQLRWLDEVEKTLNENDVVAEVQN
ncbi:MAG: PadR family transcriptional regulator [Pirellulales bacterium]|nr:PadR family transcriptional regulator [Pirellulales bacterium]